MNKRFFRHTLLWSLMLMLALSACQTPTPIQSLQKTTETQAASTAPAALPEVSAERLKEARAKLRPNTQDRLEYLYDSQKRPVSWMVVYDPPRTDPPQAGAFQTQMISDLFGDPKENVFNLVAEFEPVENITLSRYLSWYSQPVFTFGGRRAHPDPWLNQEGCVPDYEIRFRGRLHSKLPEYRYARVPSGFYNPNDPYWYLNSRRTIEVRVPPRLIPRNGGYLVSISKGGACDQSSPALQMEIDTRVPIGPGATPTPSPGPAYCSRRLQTLVLDVEENRLLGIDNEVRSLEQDLPEEGFQTQMHRPLAAPRPAPRSANFGTQGYYGDSPFFTPPSGAPTSDPTPPPNEDAPPPEPYTNLIPIEEAQAQLDRLKALATGLESRLEKVILYYEQQLSQTETDEEDLQLYWDDRLGFTKQLQESLKPAVIKLGQVTAELEMVCNHDELPVNQPRLDLIYAGFEPDGSIKILGRAFAKEDNFNLADVVPQFFEDIELLEPVPPVWEGETKRFKILIPFENYVYTPQHVQKYDFENEYIFDPEKLPGLALQLSEQTFQIQSGTKNTLKQELYSDGRNATTSNFYRHKNLYQDFSSEKVRIISAEEIAEYLKGDVTDSYFLLFGTGLAGVGTVTVLNTAIDVFVPTSILDFIPTGKVVSIGGKVFKRGAYVIQDGIKYVQLKGIQKADWDGVLFQKTKNLKETKGASLFVDITGKQRLYNAIFARANTQLQQATAGIPGASKRWQDMLGFLDNYSYYVKVRSLGQADNALSNAYGALLELITADKINKMRLRGAPIEDIRMNLHFPTGAGNTQEIDVIYKIKGKTYFVDTKAQLMYRANSDKLKKLIKLDPDTGLPNKILGVYMAARQANAVPVIWTQAISPSVVSRLSGLAAEHKLPFNPKKNIVVLEDAELNNLLKEGL
jgi:hypothetical protein